MYKFTKKQVEAWDKSMKGLDNMRKVKVIKAMPEMEVGKIMESDGEEMMQFRCGCFGMSLNIRDLIRGGWLEEVKEKSLADKMMKKKHWTLSEDSANDLAQIANEHYEKEVVDAMNKATNGIPIPILPIQRGHLVPMDEVLKIINRIRESVADVFKDKE